MSGLWGIFYFKEVTGYEKIIKWFMSALLTISGILLLSYEHHEKWMVQNYRGYNTVEITEHSKNGSEIWRGKRCLVAIESDGVRSSWRKVKLTAGSLLTLQLTTKQANEHNCTYFLPVKKLTLFATAFADCYYFSILVGSSLMYLKHLSSLFGVDLVQS